MKIERPKIGAIYKHFKGHLIEVLMIVRHTETEEEMVVYRELSVNKDYGKNSLWVRPLKMFLETIERDGKKFPRFELVRNLKKKDKLL